MIRIFKTENGLIHQKDELSPGSWIALTNPTATEILESENIFVITENRAIHQDIRPIQILILNLMPY